MRLPSSLIVLSLLKGSRLTMWWCRVKILGISCGHRFGRERWGRGGLRVVEGCRAAVGKKEYQKFQFWNHFWYCEIDCGVGCYDGGNNGDTLRFFGMQKTGRAECYYQFWFRISRKRNSQKCFLCCWKYHSTCHKLHPNSLLAFWGGVEARRRQLIRFGPFSLALYGHRERGLSSVDFIRRTGRFYAKWSAVQKKRCWNRKWGQECLMKQIVHVDN